MAGPQSAMGGCPSSVVGGAPSTVHSVTTPHVYVDPGDEIMPYDL